MIVASVLIYHVKVPEPYSCRRETQLRLLRTCLPKAWEPKYSQYLGQRTVFPRGLPVRATYENDGFDWCSGFGVFSVPSKLQSLTHVYLTVRFTHLHFRLNADACIGKTAKLSGASTTAVEKGKVSKGLTAIGFS